MSTLFMLRKVFKLKTILLTTFIILSSGCLDFVIRQPHSLKYNSISFNNLAHQIISQNQIFQMDDFTRHFKFINGISIRLTREPETGDSETVYLDKVIDSLHLDKKLVAQLRDKLEETQLRDFYKSNDSILFTVDGFLDHSWGYFYISKKIGNDTIPFQFGCAYTYVYYVYDVNDHWKKVAVD